MSGEIKLSHIYRWHKRLKATLEGPMVDDAPLHLQQSDLDGACGQHCMMMALMILGLVQRKDLGISKANRKNALGSFWRSALPYYFKGSKPHRLASFLTPYQDHVSCTVIDKHPANDVAATLYGDGLCIVGIQNPALDLDHWALAVGIGKREGKTEEKLLLLDPAIPPLPMLPWNATITLNASRRGWHRYESANAAMKVLLCDALCLIPRPTGAVTTFD